MLRHVLLIALLGACAQDPADVAPVFAIDTAAVDGPALRVWPATDELRDYATLAAHRIEVATGLTVLVTDNPNGAVPTFWTTQGTDDWLGMMHDGPGSADFIAIDVRALIELRETLVLHEMLHALGAGHVGTGAGVLSPEIFDMFPLTSADLDTLCTVRHCITYVPEK